MTSKRMTANFKANRNGKDIEALIADEEWKQAQDAIEKELDKEPEDHWLWSRLSSVKYEQRKYKEALEAAEKALEIVPDCPLALWSKATAVEMLGKTDEAAKLYKHLILRGHEELKTPDEDAEECWEGSDWTGGLVADCLFRLAGCLAKKGKRQDAVEMYRSYLRLWVLDIPSIYSPDDALERMKKLVPNKKARRAATVKETELLLAN